jgi:predicted DNA-binding protein (UPF0278 family)
MTYEEQHAALVADLKGKLHRADWHGVSDAANDLRVLEAQHQVQGVAISSDYKPGAARFVEDLG